MAQIILRAYPLNRNRDPHSAPSDVTAAQPAEPDVLSPKPSISHPTPAFHPIRYALDKGT